MHLNYDGCKKWLWENQLEFATKKFPGSQTKQTFCSTYKRI
jgi:hypothetical protein